MFSLITNNYVINDSLFTLEIICKIAFYISISITISYVGYNYVKKDKTSKLLSTIIENLITIIEKINNSTILKNDEFINEVNLLKEFHRRLRQYKE